MRLSVAPMMEWTDRHCRFFHRTLSREVLLYTEMVTSAALIRGNAMELLAHDPQEHPVVLQLGGSDPGELAKAAKLGADAGYVGVNLNVGCPSDRVQSGAFGAILMKSPDLVRDCVASMTDAVEIPITVKCRIGVDDQTPHDVLPRFLETLSEAGINTVIIHARKAWLKGLSPKDNRSIPPLDYDLVYEMKRRFPEFHISLNGGVETLEQACGFLAAGMDGVMIGRAAYHRPFDILAEADQRLYGLETPPISRFDAVERMRPYIAAHLANNGRLHHITRHMLGLFAGQPGARHWRRVLSEGANCPKAGLGVIDAALACVTQHQPA